MCEKDNLQGNLLFMHKYFNELFTEGQDFIPSNNESIYRRPSKSNWKFEFARGTVGNIVGKGENAGKQHFLLFPQCFQKMYLLWQVKIWIVLYMNK